MPVYTLQAPDGRKVKIEAADEQTAMRGAQEWYSSQGRQKPAQRQQARPAPRKPNVFMDIAKAGPTGVAKGLLDAAGTVASKGIPGGELFSKMAPVAGRLGAMAGEAFGNAIGIKPQPEARRKAEALANVFGNDRQRAAAIETLAPYKAKTRPGRYADTTGNMAVNALLTKGGAVRKAASVVVPGVLSEAAGQATQGTRYEAPARIAGAVVGGGVAGIGRPKTPLPRPPRAPSVDDLRAQRTAAYKAVDDSGMRYSAKANDDLITGIVDEMQASGIDADLHPKAFAMLKKLESRRGREPTLKEIDQLRQFIGRDIAGATEKSERFFGKKMIQNIDEWIAAAGDEQAVGAQAGAATIKRARDLHTRVSKVEQVEAAVEKARTRAGSTGSGGNINNAIRQNLRTVLERGRNWTPAERAALEEVVIGSKTQNALRQVGKLSPQGNGLMQAGHLLALGPSGGLSAVAAGVGAGAKVAADNMTKQSVLKLVRLMASGGQPAVQAEARLAAMAARNKEIAEIYRRVAKQMTLAGGVAAMGSGATAQPQQDPTQGQ